MCAVEQWVGSTRTLTLERGGRRKPKSVSFIGFSFKNPLRDNPKNDWVEVKDLYVDTDALRGIVVKINSVSMNPRESGMIKDSAWVLRKCHLNADVAQ